MADLCISFVSVKEIILLSLSCFIPEVIRHPAAGDCQWERICILIPSHEECSLFFFSGHDCSWVHHFFFFFFLLQRTAYCWVFCSFVRHHKTSPDCLSPQCVNLGKKAHSFVHCSIFLCVFCLTMRIEFTIFKSNTLLSTNSESTLRSPCLHKISTFCISLCILLMFWHDGCSSFTNSTYKWIDLLSAHRKVCWFEHPLAFKIKAPQKPVLKCV